MQIRHGQAEHNVLWEEDIDAACEKLNSHIYNTFFSSSLLFVTVTLRQLKLLILLPWTAWTAGQIRDPKLTEKGRGQAGNLRNDVILKKGLFLHPRIPTWPPSVSLAARFVSTVIIKQGQTWLVE